MDPVTANERATRRIVRSMVAPQVIIPVAQAPVTGATPLSRVGAPTWLVEYYAATLLLPVDSDPAWTEVKTANGAASIV